VRALLSIERIVNEVVERIRKLGLRDVSLVRLEGDLAGAAHDAVQFHFAKCAHDTPLAGVELELVEAAGTDLRLLELEVA